MRKFWITVTTLPVVTVGVGRHTSPWLSDRNAVLFFKVVILRVNFDFNLMQEPSGRVAEAQVTQVTCKLADLLFSN